MIMVVAMVVTGTIGLCFGYSEEETREVDVRAQITALNVVTFTISEAVTVEGVTENEEVTVSPIVITNETDNKAVNVTSIKAEGRDDWKIVSADEITNDAAGKPYLSLSIDGQDLAEDAGYVPKNHDGEAVGEGTEIQFDITGRIAAQFNGLNDVSIAKLTVTLDVGDYEYFNGYSVYELRKVAWNDQTLAKVVGVIQAIDAGAIDPKELTGWDVGASRTVELPYMAATGVGESHAAQQVELVIMDVPGSAACKTKVWTDADGQTHEASFIIGLKGTLAERGYIDSTEDTAVPWASSKRYTWLNNVFYNAMCSAMGVTTADNFFKKVSNVTGTYNGTTSGESNVTTYDYFSLPAEKEVFGSRTYSTTNEANALAQFTWYKTAANRMKSQNWWERSPCSSDKQDYCYVNTTTSKSTANASYWPLYGSFWYFSPFGCL
jgi:hypothetical protein